MNIFIYFSSDAHVTLETRRVSVIRWTVALLSVFIGFLLIVLGIALFSDNSLALGLMAAFGSAILVLALVALYFFHKTHNNNVLKRKVENA